MELSVVVVANGMLDHGATQPPTLRKTPKVGHPKKQNQLLGVDVLEWDYPGLKIRQPKTEKECATRRDEFLQHYHKRSNIESTFSMIKRKFRDSLRSKTETAMVNETLCKVLCHNLVVLIHEMHELGIDPMFWSDNAA